MGVMKCSDVDVVPDEAVPDEAVPDDEDVPVAISNSL